MLFLLYFFAVSGFFAILWLIVICFQRQKHTREWKKKIESYERKK